MSLPPPPDPGARIPEQAVAPVPVAPVPVAPAPVAVPSAAGYALHRPGAEKPPAVPVVERAHHHFLRTPRGRWWKSLLLLLAVGAAFLVISVLASFALFLDVAVGWVDEADITLDSVPVGPWLFLANNLALAAFIPASMLLQWAITGQRPGWLSSVTGRFRWGWLLRCLAVVVPLWLLVLGLGFLLEPPGEAQLDGRGLFLLIAVLLTTPFQAAGEEYAFRGLIPRVVGSWIPNSGVAFIVGAIPANLVFMLLHGAADLWLNIFYFSFGMLLSVVVWRTGGLEASVAIHVVNNLVALLPIAFLGGLEESFQREAGAAGPEVLISLAGLLIAAGLIVLWARLGKVRRLGAPAAGWVPEAAPAPAGVFGSPVPMPAYGMPPAPVPASPTAQPQPAMPAPSAPAPAPEPAESAPRHGGFAPPS
ncbi:CPBP family intramembrane glutamic endopeptidase [Homoserinibacter sp. YIM 151385]|uniref:CPBP family intramembrane glutamic endopeptidase n=1 Tax=Homoserinibacter sp. YIM 151385 TaxID=2985506 RepID=UPI0022F0459F|nr:CPBP family intramembrane glutamic endopeptidase [Homoserinibacter sp. YIM 151385]WBU37318.1 CPBP family intramembrane metalloprotease [Homoserinibacter sp. YIM 151385]